MAAKRCGAECAWAKGLKVWLFWLNKTIARSVAYQKIIQFVQLKLVPHYPVATTKLLFTPQLLLSNLRTTRLNINNRRLNLNLAKKIPFLNHKITASADLFAVVPLHGLVVGKAIFSDIALLAGGVWEAAVSVAKTVGFVVCFFGGHGSSAFLLHLGRGKY